MAHPRCGLLVATALAASALLVGGCFGPKTNQMNVPPPPLVKPKGEFRDKLYALVPVSTGNPAPLVDLRLVGSDNGLGHALYDEGQAYIRQQTLDMLSKAQEEAARQGYSLLVLDAARSDKAQRALAALVADDRLAKAPKRGEGCPETHGAAVDVALMDVRNGDRELPMGSDYMEAGPASLNTSNDADKDALISRTKLQSFMLQVGFEKGGTWWHYTDPSWKDYPEVAEGDYPHKLSVTAEEALKRAEASGTESRPAENPGG